MRQATPDQIQQVRHRRKFLTIVWPIFIGGFFVSMMVPYLLDLKFSRTLGILRGCVFVGSGLALVVLSLFYWRCPACRSPFTRQSHGKYCEKCDTNYDA
jgi:hypothetical protein